MKQTPFGGESGKFFKKSTKNNGLCENASSGKFLGYRGNFPLGKGDFDFFNFYT